MKWNRVAKPALAAAFAATILMPWAMLHAAPSDAVLPNTGQRITPLAPRGAQFESLNPGLADNPQYLAGQAATSVVSPDGKTLLVLTSGYNRMNFTSGPNQGKRNPADSKEYVFVYDISKDVPVTKQVIQVPNTYYGIVFDPSGAAFYVSGGVNDNVHAYALTGGVWAEQPGSPIKLGHTAGVGLGVPPAAACIAITQDGNKLVVADYYNDSISILSKSVSGWAKSGELDLRPGKNDPAKVGVAGGEYPFWVTIKGNDTAYISSVRDREIVVVNLLGSTPTIETRIHVPGQPSKMTLNARGTTLYVAQDLTDSVGVIDTAINKLVENISVTFPNGLLPRWALKGHNTNGVTLSPDEKFLYATNGLSNDVAVVDLDRPQERDRLIGLIPTGWYPNDVSLSPDGKFVYVINDKSPTGANPNYCKGLTPAKAAQCAGSNQYDLQLIKAGLQSFPVPSEDELEQLTLQVAHNNHWARRIGEENAEKLAFLRRHIRHVIYIIKENRTYDQILGDLEVGNGDPTMVEFPEAITPNLHNIARQFVDLDNFYDTSEVSFDGWPWSTSAHATDAVVRNVPVNYAGRGLTNDSEGTSRAVNVGFATQAERTAANPITPSDPDVLPGTAEVDAPDGREGEQGAGYLWDSALRAGLSVRNYGFFIDLARYFVPSTSPIYIPLLTDPAATHTQVSYSSSESLRPHTDLFFRGYDNAFSDFYRFKEWEREFDTKFAKGGLPNLSLVRLPHDHTGSFGSAIAGVNTPELQVADNDYAVGLVAEKIAHSRYKHNTLIFVIEDDAQDGGDHMDAHRSIAFVIGPYVKHKAVVSTAYNTLSMFRTMEDILGLRHLNVNDASALPMTNVFDLEQRDWTYNAVPSDLLLGTQLPLPAQSVRHKVPRPTHDAAYWAAATEGMDFTAEDRVDASRYNRILWEGLIGARLYPTERSGLDLRANRKELLQRYRTMLQQGAENNGKNEKAGGE